MSFIASPVQIGRISRRGPSMTLDYSNFKKGMGMIQHRVFPEAAEIGLGKAGVKLMEDCLFEEPTVPLDTGGLRASGSAFANNKLVETSEDYPQKESAYPWENKFPGPTPVRFHIEPMVRNIWLAVVIFNKPYAWKWHETEPDNGFQELGAGMKYMESKMTTFHKVYMNIIAMEIQRALR